jgi:hypothetical protein
LRINLTSKLSGGLEYYGSMDDITGSDPGSDPFYQQQQQIVGPAVSIRYPPSRVPAGIF